MVDQYGQRAQWQAVARIRGEGLLRWEAPMEKTLADIDADVASLRSNVAKYRKVAQERKARGHLLIAEKQMEFVEQLKQKIEMEVKVCHFQIWVYSF